MIYISIDVESLPPLLAVCKDGRLVQLLLCPHSMMSPKRVQGLLETIFQFQGYLATQLILKKTNHEHYAWFMGASPMVALQT
jgi:hypothetical protein